MTWKSDSTNGQKNGHIDRWIWLNRHRCWSRIVSLFESSIIWMLKSTEYLWSEKKNTWFRWKSELRLKYLQSGDTGIYIKKWIYIEHFLQELKPTKSEGTVICRLYLMLGRYIPFSTAHIWWVVQTFWIQQMDGNESEFYANQEYMDFRMSLTNIFFFLI